MTCCMCLKRAEPLIMVMLLLASGYIAVGWALSGYQQRPCQVGQPKTTKKKPINAANATDATAITCVNAHLLPFLPTPPSTNQSIQFDEWNHECGSNWSVFDRAIYNSMAPVLWSLCVGGVCRASFNGRGGLVGWFLTVSKDAGRRYFKIHNHSGRMLIPTTLNHFT